MSLRFVITGTDTGVGKSVFSAGLVHALGASYWKPIQAGLDEETDSEVVSRLGNLSPNRILTEAWKLKAPVSPHYAASLDSVSIEAEKIWPPQIAGPLVIEGAGGLCVPLSDNDLLIDVFARWKIPVILCARTSLGTINHTLLSLEAMRHRSIPIYGIAFIGDENKETERIISKLASVRILGRLPLLNPLTVKTLQDAFSSCFPRSIFERDCYS